MLTFALTWLAAAIGLVSTAPVREQSTLLILFMPFIGSAVPPRYLCDPWLMPENAGGAMKGPRRGLTFLGVLAGLIGLAVIVSNLDGTSTQPPPRKPSTVTGRPPNSSTTTQDRAENELPEIGGLALSGHHGNGFHGLGNSGGVNGAWTVVVRRSDGSLGQHGAVVTYPADTNDLTDTGARVRVGAVTGVASRGVILWPLGDGRARIRGDLPSADLLRIAELTTVAAGRPHVRPPAGFGVIAVGPALSLIHELQYGNSQLGLGSALGDGGTFTGLTIGGGFEDALYAAGSTPAGTIHGAPAVVSPVQWEEGNLAWEPSPGQPDTLAWEPSAGVVAYVGWSGTARSQKAVIAVRALAEGTHLLTPLQWLDKADLIEQGNNAVK